MVSRRSAKTIADAYHANFTGMRGADRHFRFYRDSLYDFLFVNEFDGWLLNAFKKIRTTDSRGLREFVMKLHTGESVVQGTPDWPWDRRRALGQRVLKDLAEALLRLEENDPSLGRPLPQRKATVDTMRRSLELDGFLYRKGMLVGSEAEVLDEQEEQGLLIQLIREAELPDQDVLAHHLDRSVEHYEQDRFDDAIGNSRKVLEGVLRGAAMVLGQSASIGPLSAEDLDRPSRVRDWLSDVGLLEKKEKETVAKVYGLLSETGGHPYIAHKDQARLNRHLALTLTQFVLLRLRGAMEGG